MRRQQEKTAERNPLIALRSDSDKALPETPDRSRGEQDRLPELVASRAVRESLQPVVERLLALPVSGVYCIASAQPQEGRTLVAAALSLLLSEKTDKKTLIVDAHAERPRIHDIFSAPESPGLAGCLRGEGRLRDAVSLFGALSVLPAGRHSGARLFFRTSAAKRLVDEMRDTYDITLIDLPPLMSANDEAAALCDWADGTIMVVRANTTKASTLAKAVAMIDSHKLLGVVLNQEQEDLPRWLQRML